MSVRKKGGRGRQKPSPPKEGRVSTPAPLPPNVQLDRQWLRERISWLDVDHYALKAIRGLHELVRSHSEAFREQQRFGAASERAAELFAGWGLETQQEIMQQLDLLLESVEHVRKDLDEAANPRPAVTP